MSHTTFFLAEGLASQTECHIMDSGKEGPTIFLLAGTHGNEPAGFKGAEQLLERLEPKTGRIILVPHANQQAIELNQRTASDGVDMNRSYPGRRGWKSLQILSAQIMELIQKYQPVCVVDMHEGVNFYGVKRQHRKFYRGGTDTERIYQCSGYTGDGKQPEWRLS